MYIHPSTPQIKLAIDAQAFKLSNFLQRQHDHFFLVVVCRFDYFECRFEYTHMSPQEPPVLPGVIKGVGLMILTALMTPGKLEATVDMSLL